MAQVEERWADEAEASGDEEAEASGGAAAGDAAVGLSSVDGMDGEVWAGPQGGDEAERASGVVYVMAARVEEASESGSARAVLDVVPAWAMAVCDGPIPDVAPPSLTAGPRGEVARDAVEPEATGDGQG